MNSPQRRKITQKPTPLLHSRAERDQIAKPIRVLGWACEQVLRHVVPVQHRACVLILDRLPVPAALVLQTQQTHLRLTTPRRLQLLRSVVKQLLALMGNTRDKHHMEQQNVNKMQKYGGNDSSRLSTV